MTQVKMPYTGTNFHKLTGFYTPLEMLTEEVQTTYHQYAVVLKEDKVVKMPEYVKDTYIAHDKHTPVSSIHIETNHGLNVIIPPERIVHVIPEIPLKEVEAHLRSIEGAVHLRSIDYIHSLAIRLAVPKVVFKGVPIDTFIYKESASSIHTALMTLIRSDSFLAESELLKKDVTLEVQIVNDEFIRNSKNPYGEITLEVQIKSESIKEYYEQVYPHLSPELKIQTDTFFDKLTKLSKLTLNEIPIDCFVWREELPDGTTKVTLNVV
jgi:hypothetical protein